MKEQVRGFIEMKGHGGGGVPYCNPLCLEITRFLGSIYKLVYCWIVLYTLIQPMIGDWNAWHDWTQIMFAFNGLVGVNEVFYR